MKKLNLNNIYESSFAPTDIRVLWADVDKSTGDIKAIHRYNQTTKEWEPYLVAVGYMQPDDPDDGGKEV